MPWIALAGLAVLAAAVAWVWWLAWRPPRRRRSLSARLAARLGGQCSICHQVGHTSREHVRLPNSMLQARHKGDWGDLCG
jgi:mono/diheme cytochrome c family protein